MKITEIYDKAFYDAQSVESYKSARNLLPYVDEILAPKSVIDIGCGVGTWLKAWSDISPNISIAGVDGNDVDSSFIPRESYLRIDLTDYHTTSAQAIITHFAKMGGGSSQKYDRQTPQAL